MTVDLSICIVHLNAAALLRDCLRSIREGTRQIGYECIVVDNGSGEASLTPICAEFPDVRFIRNGRNLGFAHATNQALAVATGRHCLWLNPDTVVREGALEALVAFADAHPEIGIVGPRVLNRDGTLQKQCRRSFPTPWVIFSYYSGLGRLFPRSRVFGRYLLEYEDDTHPLAVDAVSGAALMVQREALTQIGPLDEAFFAYGEDLDYCYRARQAGWEVYYYPGAEIVHLGGQGGSTHQPWKAIYEYHRSMVVYYRKHLAAHYPLPINGLVYAGITLRGLAVFGRNLFRREKRIGSKKP